MAHTITCISIGTYRGALTRGRRYELLEENERKGQVRVCGDNGRVRWYQRGCFDLTGGPAPVLTRWGFDNAYESLSGEIEEEEFESLRKAEEKEELREVHLYFDDRSRRWCIVATPARLREMVERPTGPPWLWTRHMIVVREITFEIVDRCLREMDSQGELMEASRPF